MRVKEFFKNLRQPYRAFIGISLLTIVLTTYLVFSFPFFKDYQTYISSLFALGGGALAILSLRMQIDFQKDKEERELAIREKKACEIVNIEILSISSQIVTLSEIASNITSFSYPSDKITYPNNQPISERYIFFPEFIKDLPVEIAVGVLNLRLSLHRYEDAIMRINNRNISSIEKIQEEFFASWEFFANKVEELAKLIDGYLSNKN